MKGEEFCVCPSCMRSHRSLPSGVMMVSTYAPRCQWHPCSIHQECTEAWTVVDNPPLQSWVVVRSQALGLAHHCPWRSEQPCHCARVQVRSIVPKHPCYAQTGLASYRVISKCPLLRKMLGHSKEIQGPCGATFQLQISWRNSNTCQASSRPTIVFMCTV